MLTGAVETSASVFGALVFKHLGWIILARRGIEPLVQLKDQPTSR
jgi:hypothetical protein